MALSVEEEFLRETGAAPSAPTMLSAEEEFLRETQGAAPAAPGALSVLGEKLAAPYIPERGRPIEPVPQPTAPPVAATPPVKIAGDLSRVSLTGQRPPPMPSPAPPRAPLVTAVPTLLDEGEFRFPRFLECNF